MQLFKLPVLGFGSSFPALKPNRQNNSLEFTADDRFIRSDRPSSTLASPFQKTLRFGRIVKNTIDDPYADFELLPYNVAVIDVGSRETKGLIRFSNGKVRQFKFNVFLGSALGQPNNPMVFRNALNDLRTNWKDLKIFLESQGVAPENTRAVATEGLRGHGKAGQTIADELGIEIIDGKQEGRYIRDSVIRNIEDGRDDIVVLEMGGGSTELAFPGMEQNLIFPLGVARDWNWGTAADNSERQDPFDEKTIKAFKTRIDKIFDAQDNAVLPAIGKQLYISPKYELIEIHKRLYPDKDLTHEPLTLSEIDEYLTQTGLSRLLDISREIIRSKVDPQFNEKFIPYIIVRLAILSAFMHKYLFDEVHIGASGGMKTGLLRNFLFERASDTQHAENLKAYFSPMGRRLASEYKLQLNGAVSQMTQIFGQYPGRQIIIRPKTEKSIISKLVSKALRMPYNESFMHISKARELVADAIGARIILADGSQKEMAEIVQSLARAVETGELQILEMHNYRSRLDGLPYFQPSDILTLKQAVNTAKRRKLLDETFQMKEFEPSEIYTRKVLEGKITDLIEKILSGQLTGQEVKNEFDDLHRQPFFKQNDVARVKAAVANAIARQVNPQLDDRFNLEYIRNLPTKIFSKRRVNAKVTAMQKKLARAIAVARRSERPLDILEQKKFADETQGGLNELRGQPALTPGHIQTIVAYVNQAKSSGALPKDFEPEYYYNLKREKEIFGPTGYTTVQMNVRYSNGVLGEIQIRGPEVNKLGEVEHLIYDIRQGKTRSNDFRDNHEDLARKITLIENTIRGTSEGNNLTPPQVIEYFRYLDGLFRNARLRELGRDEVDVREFDDIIRTHPHLSIEQLAELDKQLKTANPSKWEQAPVQITTGA